ncbi:MULTISPECIES: PGF-pre-PGF domain-containing protein [Haloferax]|uniref:PGF-pre-PGF domain-containing protein n=1 Tax=Haloferax TaxID=2251 RepID=UPI001E2C8882|nr:PGF-pre-PGF domain-containing protein [Haloferax mediterranei]MDX5989232.1 PGF-pre-PGF domain-containing protein [Haloferax mediterranei ATCC 33500]
MKRHRERFLTLLVVFVVVTSVVPLGAMVTAAAGLTVPSSSPEVQAQAQTTITPGQTTDIGVAYNVTGAVDQSDLTVSVVDPAGQGTLVSNSSSPPLADSTTMSIPDGALDTGAKRLAASTYNSSSGQGIVSQMFVVDSGGNVTIDSYTVSETAVDPGETFWVNATLNNTGGVSETFEARVYGQSWNSTPMNNTTQTLAGGATTTVNLSVAYGSSVEGTTQDLTVNNETATSVQINDTNDGGGSSSSASNVTVSDQSTTTGSTVDVTVQYNVTNSVSLTDANLTLRGPNGVIDYNDSLSTLDGSVTFTLPAKAAAGEYRVRAAVIDDSMQWASLNPVAEDVFSVNVTNNVTLDSYVVEDDPLFKGQSYPVNVTLNNTGSTAQNYTVHVYPKTGSYEALNSSTFEVQPNSERNVSVLVSYGSSYTSGTYQLAVGNETPVSVAVDDLATVTDWSVVSGPTNTTVVESSVAPPSGQGGLLQFDLNDYQKTWPQNLSGTGLANDSEIRVTLHVNHSYEPGVLIATAQNVSMNVTNKSTYYEVNVTGNPIESQYTSNASGVSDWETLSESEDQANAAFKPMFSLAFVSNDSVQQYNPNMSGLVIGTDAQAFTPPRYNETAGQLEVEVAGPHRTVDGDNNTGRFEATLPSALLNQWGVSSPSDLSADYEGENKTVNAQSNSDSSIDIGFDIHYSAGQINLAPAEETDSESSDSSSSSDSTTSSESEPSSSTSDDDDDDAEPVDTDDDSTTTTSSNDSTDVTVSVAGADAASVTSNGEETTVTVTNASSEETVSIDLEQLSTASNTTTNTTETNETAANATQAEAASNDTQPSVSKLDLNLSSTAPELGVSVSSADEVPDGTPEYTGADSDDSTDVAVIDYLQIDLSGTTDEDIEDATITFTVPSDRLEQTGTDPANVTLSRYHDGEWQTLETTHLGGDRYAAVTPGFSVFAISSQHADTGNETTTEDATQTEPASETTASETTTTAAQTTQSDAPGFGVTVALTALALVAARVWRD